MALRGGGGEADSPSWEPLPPHPGSAPKDAADEREVEQEANAAPEGSCCSPTVRWDRTHRSPPTPLPALPLPARMAPDGGPRAGARVLPNRTHARMPANRPLQLLCGRFLVHFARELWQLDLRLRLAFLCAALSAGSQVLLVSAAATGSMIRLLRPAGALFLVVLPLLHLHPELRCLAFAKATAGVAAIVSSSPWGALDRLGDGAVGARRLFLCLQLLPTILEVYTLHSLGRMIVSDASKAGCVAACCLLAAIIHMSRSAGRCSPRECSRRGLLALLGMSWLLALQRFRASRLVTLSPPLFAGLAAVLWSMSIEDAKDTEEERRWSFSGPVRRALRSALRDVLAAGASGDNDASDEYLLQLAALRWIVDYWASQPPSRVSPASSGNGSGASSDRRASSTPAALPSNATDCPTAAAIASPDLSWDELLPMLSLATDQMRIEVQQLQDAPPSLLPSAVEGVGGANPAPSSSHSSPFGMQTTTETPPTGRQEGGSEAGVGGGAPSSSSFEGLQSMLANMDLDGRAKPAVAAYKRAVQSFPPSAPTALLLATVRRCPALLAVVLHILGCLPATSSYSSFHWLAESLLLVPLVAMELLRAREWSEHCHRAAPCFALPEDKKGTPQPTDLSHLEWADPMLLLLSDDRIDATHPPSLLRVWLNIRASVRALETGLTAARCVQTSAAAAQFATHLRPLVQLGVQVGQHGWWYGCSVLLRELLALYAASASSSASNPRSAAPHIDAALKAVGHSQTVARNLRILADEGYPQAVALDPVWALLAAIVGRGWLWGREVAAGPPRLSTPASTVTIEEVNDNEDDACDTVHSSVAPPNAASALDDNTPNCSGTDDTEEANNVFGLHLRDHVKAMHAEAPMRELEQTFVDRLSNVMELVATCAEQQLLSDHEKNELYERLANLQTGGQITEDCLVDMEKKLQALLPQSESLQRDQLSSDIHLNPSPSGDVSVGRIHDPSIQHIPPHITGPMQSQVTQDGPAAQKVDLTPPTTLTPSTTKVQRELGCDRHEHKPTLYAEVVAAQAESPLESPIEARGLPEQGPTDESDYNDFEPILLDSRIEKAVIESRKECHSPVAFEAQSEDVWCHALAEHSSKSMSFASETNDASENNNILLQLGGGLAVLGAVIGSAAAVAMIQTDRDRKSSRNREPDKQREAL